MVRVMPSTQGPARHAGLIAAACWVEACPFAPSFSLSGTSGSAADKSFPGKFLYYCSMNVSYSSRCSLLSSASMATNTVIIIASATP